ncbi:MerR family DNA-binding transcriptional regulator [Variovorax sp. LjRoot84]|uniref:MerR family transcriptional regulator n=1 Tax=unclassified Variovorax TaxID=663243 RepID=UPI003ED10CAF
MRISELAQRAGVTVHALRHYERLGLLLPARTDSGYRDYPESMRREVVFIAMARRIGFSLPAIAELLPAYRTGRLSITRMTDALEERVAALDAQIAELQALRAQVIEHAAWLRAQRRKPPAAAKKKAPWPKTSTTSSSKDKR